MMTYAARGNAQIMRATKSGVNLGIHVFFAAGNAAEYYFPTEKNSVVGDALSKNRDEAQFSNQGSTVDILAPGKNI